VALGGNAITHPDKNGDVADQFDNSRRAARPLADLIEAEHQIILTHGNGPQIGNFLLRNEAAADRIYPLPMEVALAHVQGGMGYMIGQTLANELAQRGLERVVTTIVTTILVEGDDPSFAEPTKPIGRALTRKEAELFARHEGWSVKEVSAGTFRRVVPSPVPKRIMEIDHIRRAVDAGEILVACGGGGIPVLRGADNCITGTRAVIDKDLCAALLAAELDADAILVLTNVERVSVDFGTPNQRPIERMTAAEADNWLKDGQFPAGSMGPKIQGAINYLRASAKPDAHVIIGPLDHAAEALAGRTGTRICR